MVATEQVNVYVHLLPQWIPPGTLRGGIVVVVDVLRATSVMVEALAAGCEAVIPCGEIDEAKAIAAALPTGTALLAGERLGLPIPGFDLGNSPGDFTPQVCRDKTVVITTTNGTRAILASMDAERLYVASFTNLRATSAEIRVQFQKDPRRSVHIVCAGTEGSISLEDSLLAGALACRLAQVSELPPRSNSAAHLANDEALIAVTEWLDVERLLERRPLWKLLSLGRGGQNVLGIDRKIDIEQAAGRDRFDLVAVVQRSPFRIVAV
jgi:2-phosphosulfolactate phosphatase